MRQSQEVDGSPTELHAEPKCGNTVRNQQDIYRGRICKFYRGRCVLITGGTGFLGKVTVEKLLRSCPEVGTVFLLMRPKRGRDPEERFREFLTNPIFNRVRATHPTQLSKLRLVSGDVSRPNLGLSDADQKLLQEEVNVVLHSAATVKFNEPLRLAVIINTLGTRRVIEFVRSLSYLHAFVHVSTAYTNPDRKVVEEKVYPPPADPDTMIKFVNTMDPDILSSIEHKLIGKHPNTYTFTKAMAESIIMQEASDLPTIIIRPSIVTAAWQEPAPGWIDNTSGITGMCMEVGRGTVRSILCDKDMNVNIIPVDVVVNAILAAAAHRHWHSYSDIPILNVTSEGIPWQDLRLHVLKTARQSPSKYVQWYPNVHFSKNVMLHRTYQALLHCLPAFILDIVMRAQGLKPIMMKLYERTRKSAQTGEFFATNEFDFKNQGLKEMAAALHFKDKLGFAMDPSQLKWDSYVNTMILGIRQYVLKDDFSSIPSARKKLKILYWSQQIIQAVGLFLLLKSVDHYLPQPMKLSQIFSNVITLFCI